MEFNFFNFFLQLLNIKIILALILFSAIQSPLHVLNIILISLSNLPLFVGAR